MEDYILNGTAHGNVATRLILNDGDPLAMRPFIGQDGREYILRNVNGEVKPILAINADATLRHEEWLHIDQAILRVARERLRAVQDLRDRGLTYTIPNGMGSTVMLSEKQSDINDATISMDGIREGANDRPVYDTDYLPLPIIHKDFHFSARQILASRNGNTPLDTSMVEMATRKVAETAEKLLLGITTYGTYGGGTIQGYTNFTSALTATLTTPVGNASTRGATLIAEVLAMRQQLHGALYFGPYMLYNAPNWDQYLDEDFKANSDKSVRQRLMEIEGIQGPRTLDYLTGHDLIMVQMTSEVVREVIGMDIQALQWESHGGLQTNFKVMAIMVPQLRADYNGNTGVCYGSI
jgi:uncharacterized linocin/CFP29 family protein